MIRKIECRDCARGRVHLLPQDIEDGWLLAVEWFIVEETLRPFGAELCCDVCYEVLQSGDTAAGVSMWQEERDPQFTPWVADYGQIISEETAMAAQKLEGVVDKGPPF